MSSRRPNLQGDASRDVHDATSRIDVLERRVAQLQAKIGALTIEPPADLIVRRGFIEATTAYTIEEVSPPATGSWAVWAQFDIYDTTVPGSGTGTITEAVYDLHAGVYVYSTSESVGPLLVTADNDEDGNFYMGLSFSWDGDPGPVFTVRYRLFFLAVASIT